MSQQHALASWSQYLQPEDYEYLIQFVENVKNGLPNDKMIILCGPGRTGKTTIQNEIRAYLTDVLCGHCSVNDPGSIIYSEYIKRVVFFCGIDEISRSKKSNQAIVNLIKYKQSFIGAATNRSKIHDMVQDNARIIYMTHVF